MEKPPKKNYKLLKPGEMVDTKCYQQQLTNLNRYYSKKGQHTEEATQTFFNENAA